MKLQEIRNSLLEIERFIADTVLEYRHTEPFAAKSKDCQIAVEHVYDAVYELEKKLDTLQNVKEKAGC